MRSPRPSLLSMRARSAEAALAVVVALALAGCESSRPAVPFNPIARHYAREEGRQMIAAACSAHGGYRVWQNKQDVSFRISDRWKGLAARMLRPWPADSANGEFEALLTEGYGKVTIADKRGRVTYAFGPGGPWTTVGGRSSQEQDDLATAEAVVPAYLFFFQMPFGFLSYGAVHHYLGVKPAPPGGPVHEVLITYPWFEGDISHDWYVARFDTSTMLLRSVTYTASRWGPSLIEYTDEVGGYVEVDSLRLPTDHRVRMTRPFRPGLHRWVVSEVRFNQGLTDSAFRGPAGLASR